MSMAVANTAPKGSALWTRAFWKGAAERAIKTFGQSVLGSFGVLEGANILANDQADQALSLAVWQVALLVGLVNAALSVLTSVANADFVAGDAATPVVPLDSPAPEAVVVPDGTGEHRAGSPAVSFGPVIHEG